MKHRISRRAFLRGCTLLAASAAVGSLTSCGGTNAKDSSLRRSLWEAIPIHPIFI